MYTPLSRRHEKMPALALLLVAVFMIGFAFVVQQITGRDTGDLMSIIGGVLVGLWLLWAIMGIVKTRGKKSNPTTRRRY